MKLLPIKETMAENEAFADQPGVKENLEFSVEHFKKTGYQLPWIGYLAQKDEHLVGFAAFKNKPVNGQVEIAYTTIDQFQHQGVGSEMCKALVQISHNSDPSIVITARTLPEKNFSTQILEKNGFELLGSVIDPEDGKVWEWKHKGSVLGRSEHLS